ncbi:START domain-containing protein [Pseudoalteromonas sp. SSDWG2]|uniref:START domain-containing protein n=1 Tax=Pseudoalteromonas sp. SSDWG2 TaxID=3139391 RepID=UPI003BAA829F
MKRLAILNLIGATSVALTSFASMAASQPTWHTFKKNNTLHIQYSNTEQGHYHIKAKVFVKGASTAQFISLLYDTEHAPNWLEGVKQVRLLTSPQPHHNVVFTHLNSPWPVSDRELYTHSCYEQLSETQNMLTIRAINPAEPKRKGTVRIVELQASWHIAQQDEGLALEYQVEADPGGAIPTWVSNKVSLKSVYKTLTNLSGTLASTEVLSPLPLRSGNCDDFVDSEINEYKKSAQ